MVARLKAQPYSLAILGAILLGAFVRLFAALTADFPLNDGGMFYIMARDIRDAHYALPDTTSYNAAGIPFVYPPLGFYLAALLADLSGASLLDVVRVLPPILTVLTIPAFYLLSRELLQARFQVTLSVFAFALLPRSFEWLVMGGGLTRSIGFLVAILLLQQVYRLYTRQQPAYILSSIVLGSAVVLSHPGTSWFTCLSVGVLFFFFGRSWRNVQYSLLIALGIVVLTSPWWITVVSRHGIEPLLAAFQTRSSIPFWAVLPLNLIYLTGEPFLSLLLVSGYLGVVAALAAKKHFLPVWLLVILLVDPRSAPTDAMIPLSMLIALTFAEIFLPALTRGAKKNARLTAQITAVFLACFLIYAFISATAISVQEDSLLRSLPIEEHQAMAWISSSTAQDSRFIVLSSADYWEVDTSAEWFPALAQRTSVNTVQGYEWLPNKKFERQRLAYLSLRKCLDDGLSCLEQDERTYDYVYINSKRTASDTPEKYYPALIDALKASSDYKLVYETEHVTLFERLQPASE